jgi:uncharacterized protein YkwD
MPPRGTILTGLPFALVFVLAAGLGIAALFATPSRSSEVAAPTPSGSAAVASAPSTSAAPTSSSPASAAPSLQPTTSPVVSEGANAAPEMLRVHNELRVAVGAPAVRGDDRVTAAAQRHAEYLARNNMLGHEESTGDPGFTGISVRDRLVAQGYPDTNASEVATSFGNGVDGVRSLWVLPYHRLGLMHPHAIVAGWGHAEVGGRSTTVGVILYDFGSPAPDLIRSPAAGQKVAGTWDGEEFPDVLPAGAARPVGYPIMVVFSTAQATELRSARLTDMSGRDVPTHTVPQIYERDYAAIVPATPLAAGTRYHVRLELHLGTADVTQEWDFETER